MPSIPLPSFETRDGASRACTTTQLLSDSSDVTKVKLHHDIISTVTHVCF